MSSEKVKKPIKVEILIDDVSEWSHFEIGMEFLKKQLMNDIKFEMTQLGIGDFEINITKKTFHKVNHYTVVNLMDFIIDENKKLHICGKSPDCSGFEIEEGLFKIKGFLI